MEFTFKNLCSNYPIEHREKLFILTLGGDFIDLYKKKYYENTCAVRMSATFNRIGGDYEIPKHYGIQDGGHTTAAGNHIIVRIKTIFDYYNEKCGQPFCNMNKPPGSQFNFSTLPSVTGILLYHSSFSDVSGHTDLWTGTKCFYACPILDVATAFDIVFWKVD